MTKDDVIRMAQEAGFVEYELDDGTTNSFDVRYKRFAHLVAAAEREACAAICEEEEELRDHTPFDAAVKIRARGENT
jgi:hypothetical protein